MFLYIITFLAGVIIGSVVTCLNYYYSKNKGQLNFKVGPISNKGE